MSAANLRHRGGRVSNLPGGRRQSAVASEQQACCIVRGEETHAQNRTHRSFGASAPRSFADLAVQHCLGLLSERRARIDALDRADPGACEKTLASITGRGPILPGVRFSHFVVTPCDEDQRANAVVVLSARKVDLFNDHFLSDALSGAGRVCHVCENWGGSTE